MDCLLCGKQIRPSRISRDDEFCCADHRRQHREHLGELLSAPLPLQRGASGPPIRGFVPLEFYCRNAAAAPSHQPLWNARKSEPLLPGLELQPVFDDLEKLLPSPAPKQSRQWRGSLWVRHGIPALAAGLALCTLVVTGAGTIRSASQTTTPGTPSTVARLRKALAERAAATITDNFRESYVRAGTLSLLSSTGNDRDYRMEFCGEIETKSIDWAVRASNPRNYYAMKLTVIEPGLRPMVALVHYAVIDGKSGKPARIPLNVMVHNHQPLRVEVDVRGNRMATSIDGQLVDTWIDDALPSGGVGFFSDAGERARLYWVTVTRNDDFVGRICGYLSRVLGADSQTGEQHLTRPRGSGRWNS